MIKGGYMANISIAVDDELKNQAEEVFDELGINMTSAIKMYLKAVVRKQGIPFDLVTGKASEDMKRPAGD